MSSTKRKPQVFPPVDSTPTPEQHIAIRRRMFKEADKRAEEMLFMCATGLEGLLCDCDDDVYALMQMSTHWPRAEAEYNKSDGDLICAVTDAALMMGLAFGLRLRGFGVTKVGA